MPRFVFSILSLVTAGVVASAIANRMWLKIMGAPVLGSPTDIVAPADSANPELADHLAELMLACSSDLKKFQAILMNTRTYQSESVPAEGAGDGFAFQGPVLRRLTAEQIWDSHTFGSAQTPSILMFTRAGGSKTSVF